MRVFLSSTSVDLREHREAAIRVCNELGLVPVAMEFFEAMSAGATQGSRRQLETCDLYVGFFARRYGYIEDGYPAGVTELEFDHAGEIGLDRLCFVVDPAYDWPGEVQEEHQDRLSSFKEKVDRQIRAKFSTPESLANELWKALRAWLDGPSRTLRDLLSSGRLDLPKGEVRPGKLLTAAYEVICFEQEARAEELDHLGSWCAQDQPHSVLLWTGPGGSGKTRLLIEACRRMADQGWAAGFLRSTVTASELDPLFAPGPARLIVLDYAETRLELLKTLLDRLTARSTLRPKIRLALVARRQGDWWAQLHRTSDAVEDLLRGWPPRRLSALVEATVDRQAAFERAAARFAHQLGKPLPEPLPLPDLTDSVFDRALYLHMAALAAVEGEPIRRGEDALKKTLEHETRFWAKEAEELAGERTGDRELLEEVFAAAVATLTLSGGVSDQAAANQLLEPCLAGLDSNALRKGTLQRLRRLYGGADGRYLEPLEPDLLGEELVHQTLSKDPAILDQMLERADASQAAHSLTVLTRLAQDLQPAATWLDAALRTHLPSLALPALEVAVQTGDPVGRILAQHLDAGAPAAITRAVMERCDRKDYQPVVPLREAACAATQQTLSSYRQIWNEPDLDQQAQLAAWSSNFGVRLGALGRREDALKASEEAVELRRRLAVDRPEAFLPDLAMSLHNLGMHLGALGRREEALVASEEAAELCRRLAADRPEAFLPDLAMSLNNLGIRLSALGRREDALRASEEAAELYRRLAADRPEAFLPDLARSLGVLGSQLLDAAPQQACEVFREALSIVAPLFEQYPSALSGLVGALVRGYSQASEAAEIPPDEKLLAPILQVLEEMQSPPGDESPD